MASAHIADRHLHTGFAPTCDLRPKLFNFCSGRMTGRTELQSKADEHAFPVHIWFQIPPNGFGRTMMPMYKWLDRHIEKASYALHGGGGKGGRDRIALYFRCPHDVSAFAEVSPDLQLADGTTLPRYYSSQCAAWECGNR